MANIPGTAGGDVLVGTPQADVIAGFGGADLLFGGSGRDSLIGGPPSAGGADDDDQLTGGPGIDRVFGRDDDDTLIWNDGDGSDEVVNGGLGFDTLQVNGADPGIDRFFSV